MKYIVILISFLICSFIAGCVFVDDDCHYETKCTYTDHCSYVCDQYGYNCYADECHQTVDRCWDEYVCRDDYDYRR
jgi:hypothetical protein